MSKHEAPSIGISGISVYVPERPVALEGLAEARNAMRGEGDRRDFLKSLRYTDQEQMRIPEIWEDTVTMIAESVRTLVEHTGIDPRTVTQFLCGTETPKDNAKPLTSFAQGLLAKDDIPLGPNTGVYEIKHACAGGTYALLAAASQMVVDSLQGLDRPAVVTMGDTSRYDLVSTAELTQGAGAVSMLVERDPSLIRLDLGVTGYHSTSVDDFFRAIGSKVARARGKYSVECYKEALLGAYLDYKAKALEAGLIDVPDGEHFLDQFDYVLLHAPFRRMPIDALVDLLAKARDIEPEEAEAELDRLRARESVEGTGRIGNVYTGSLYVCLGSLLENELDRLGDDLEGKRILFGSYGSGNTMIVFSGTVVPGAAEAIRNIGLREALSKGEFLGIEDYESRISFDKFDREAYLEHLKTAWGDIPDGRYYLQEIREDGYREYGVKGREAKAGDASAA